jgi:hypothetical protein
MRKRKTKLALRIFLYSLLLGLIFYALLPWLLPMGLLKRKLIAQLERDFERPVQIGDITVSWGRGVQIRDLVIRRKPEYGAGELLRVGRLHTSFTPLEMVYSGLNVILMEDVNFYVVVTQEHLNVIDLPPLEMSQLIVDMATVHFETHLEGEISKVIFDVGSAVIDNDKETEAFSWEFSARQLGQSEPTFVSRGQIGQFENKSREQNQQKIWLSIRDMDLATLRLDRWINLGLTSEEESETLVSALVSRIQGGCSAEVNLQLADNQEMSGEGWFEVEDLKVTGRKGSDDEQLWGALDTVTGRFKIPKYDPVTNWLRVAQLEIACPGLALRGEGVYDPREGAAQYLTMKVHDGRLEPNVLAQAVPVLHQESWEELLGQGQLQFGLEFTAHERSESGRLVLDGTNWGLEIDGFSKRIGEPLKLDLSSELDHDKEILSLTVGNLQWASLTGKGHITLHDWYKLISFEPESDPEQELRRILDLLVQGSSPSELQANIAIGEISEFSPYLDHWLGSSSALTAAGSAQAEILVKGDTNGQAFSLRLQLPETTACVWKNADKVIWRKEQGKEFQVEGSGRWKLPESVIENATLRSSLGAAKVSFGPGRLQFRDNVINHVGTGLPAEGSATSMSTSLPATTDITGHLQSPLLAEMNGRWKIEGVSDWLIALPILKHELTKQGIDLQGSVQGDMTYRHDAARTLEWSDQIDFTELQIQVSAEKAKSSTTIPSNRRMLLFEKSVGEMGKVSVSAKEDQTNHTIDYHVQAQMGSIEGRCDGQAVRLVSADDGRGPVRHRHWDLEADIKKIEDLPRYFGELFDGQGWMEEGGFRLGNLQGPVHLKGQWHIGELAESFQFTFDGSKGRFVLAEIRNPDQKQNLWNKQAASPFTIDGELTITEKNGLIGTLIGKPGKRPPARLAKIKRLELNASGIKVNGTGDVIYELSEDEGTDWLSTCRQIKLNLEGDLDYDGVLRQEVPRFAKFQEQVGLHGRTHLVGSLGWNRDQKRLQCSGVVDLTDTAATFTLILDPNESEPVPVNKPAGDDLRFAFAFGTQGPYDVLNLEKIQTQFGENTITLSGQLRGVRWSDVPSANNLIPFIANPITNEVLAVKEADWQLNVQSPELQSLTKWLGPLREMELAGQLEADINLFQQYEPTATTYFQPSRMTGTLRWKLARWPMELHIRDMELSSARLVVPEATVRIGENHLTLVSDVTEPILSWEGFVHELQRPNGRIDIISGKLDLDDMQEFLNVWQEQSLAAPFVPEAKTTGDSAAAFRYEDIRDFLWKLQRCELTGKCEFDNLSFTDPANAVRMDLDKVLGRYEIRDGIFQMQFAAGVGGGAVEATIRCDLKAKTPKILYSQTARQLQANEMLRGIVESEFPGLEVTGTISEKKELTGDLYQILETNQGWQGEGVTQCTQGILLGPGGPGWILRVFPGLKLVAYSWREFTNNFNLSSDGTKENKILFKGETYNIYVDGVSKPIQNPDQYQSMLEALETDLKDSREKLRALNEGDLELNEDKARRLRLLSSGLEELWQKHQQGQKLRTFKADYNVGGLISAGGRKEFQKPTEILRIPIFRTQSYIVGRYMVGIKTSNIAIGPLGR